MSERVRVRERRGEEGREGDREVGEMIVYTGMCCRS